MALFRSDSLTPPPDGVVAARGRVLRPVDWGIVAGLALASTALLGWAVGDWRWVAGFAAGLLATAAILLLHRRLAPAEAAGAVAAYDWSVVRAAADDEDAAVAITDRAGRLVCANQRYEEWFGGYPTPPALPLDASAVDALKGAARAAWRDGEVALGGLSRDGRHYAARVRRAGRADDHLVWRLTEEASEDAGADFARLTAGPFGTLLSNAGVMAALVSPSGIIRVTNEAFAVRAAGRADERLANADLAALLRVDEQGMLFFASEGERATPVRLIQVPVASGDAAAPILILLVDEDGGSGERGIAQTYVESLLTSLPFGLALVDRDGRFLFTNQAFARAAGVEGQRSPRYPSDIVVAEDKGPLSDAVRRHSHGQSAASDVAVRLIAQPEETVSARVVGVRGLGDAAVLVTLKDNSEESQLKRQVAQATKMQAVGQLAGGIAHDFNNILTAIIGACDLMLMRHTPGDGDYDDIQQVRSNANRAASLTRQLLAFSRQQTLRPQILQLADVVSEVSHLLKRLIGDTINLTVRHGRGVGAVRADPGQLEQVIVNLAVNARDAMPDGGQLTIETFALPASEARRMGAAVMPVADYSGLRISDQGTGIPPDVLPKIFEPFFTTKDVGKGTGLGLSTVYGIVKQSAGFIFAESTPGQGTTFTIFLPVHHGGIPERAPAAALPKPQAAEEWGTGTILLVEDEDMVRAVAERALTRAGYTVVTAANGEEGLERIAAMEAIDLLVSDVVMPTLDGPSMVTEIRRERPALPVLFMSGYAEEQLRKSIDLNRVSFLPKPFSVAQLTETVARVLAEERGAANAPATGTGKS